VSFPKHGRRHYGPGCSRQRHHSSGGPSRDPASSSEPEGPGAPLRGEPQDDRHMAQADFGGRPANRPWRATPLHPIGRAGGRTHASAIVAFRRHTLLPLDDCLYALQATLPQLARSALHRCLQRHGIPACPRSRAIRQPRSHPDPLARDRARSWRGHFGDVKDDHAPASSWRQSRPAYSGGVGTSECLAAHLHLGGRPLPAAPAPPTPRLGDPKPPAEGGSTPAPPQLSGADGS
jgi:hypothetical protein